MSSRLATGRHDGEALPGLPEPLPDGERLLWQGAPDARLLARHGLHLRGLALYFALLVAWRGVSVAYDGASAGTVALAMLWPLPLAALALGFIVLLARLVARTTLYTLTDRRIVMRIGIVLTITFNLPLSRIETARLHALGRAPGGQPRGGDIALVLDTADRIGYLHLWPHARPWRLRRTEPMLRALPDADVVARLLVDALRATVPAGTPVVAPAPAGAGKPARHDTRGHGVLPHAA